MATTATFEMTMALDILDPQIGSVEEYMREEVGVIQVLGVRRIGTREVRVAGGNLGYMPLFDVTVYDFSVPHLASFFNRTQAEFEKDFAVEYEEVQF